MWRSLKPTERRILATASVLLLTMLYFLYDDSLLLSSTKESSNHVIIGKIESSDKDVRRKFKDQFNWTTAHSDDLVHSGDSIFTGQGSSVEIKLNDGRKMLLRENSLAVFKKENGQMQLDLKFGKMTAPIDGCMNMSIKGQQREICADKNAPGPVEIDSEDPALSQASEKEAEPLRWVNIPPAHWSHYKNQTALKMSWQTSKKFARYHLQFSKHEDFKNIVFSERTQDEQILTRGYPSRGEYYVRVRADDLQGRPAAFSAVSKMIFQEVGIPSLTSPASAAHFAVRTSVDGELMDSNQISFEWKYDLPNSKFDFELASDKNFETIVDRQSQITETKWLSPPLTAGSYYARVRDATSESETHRPWSSVLEFSVEILPRPVLAEPQLLAEKIDYQAPNTKKVKLAWNPVADASQYVVEMANSPKFKESQKISTESTELTLPNPTPGSTYFRVFAETKKGTRSRESRTGELKVTVKTPEIQELKPQIIQGRSPEDPGLPLPVQLSWSDLQVVDSYLVEVSQDPSFAAPAEYSSSTPSTEVTLPTPGDYYWRVQARSKMGKPQSAHSKTGELKYILKVPLATPTLVEPFDQVTLFLQKNESPYVWFEWKEVRQATRYHLEISTDRDFQKGVVRVTTPARRYLVKNKMPSSTLYWRVQAQNDEKISFWSPPRKLNVFSGRAPAGRKAPVMRE